MYETVLGLKKPIFGLDIGYQTLKVMQLKGEGQRAKLFGVSEIAIPPRSLTKDGIKDKNLVAEAIVRAMRGARPHPITARLVSSALPESLVFTKSLDMPNMKPEEINKNIPYRASEFFPVPASEVYMDWQIVGTLSGQKSIDVLVVAAPKNTVDSLAETIKIAGLELASLETKPVADIRALVSPTDANPYLVIDIGAKTSSVTCYDQQTIKLTSTISVSGDDLAKDFKTNIKSLATEIANLIKYYQNRIGEATIFRGIILGGGGANVANVAPSIEAATKIKTIVGLPIIKAKNYNSKYATVIGLAMKKI